MASSDAVAKSERARHLQWLQELTRIPTASGREGHVIEWVTAWAEQRGGISLRTDPSGNLVLAPASADTTSSRPVYLTAHLDHPAFVVEQSGDDGRVRLSFRGSVRDPYFTEARVRLHGAGGRAVEATIVESVADSPFRRCVGELDEPADWLRPGDVGIWSLPEPHVEQGILHTNACDDLAAVAAALGALDLLVARGVGHVRVLLTRAEEVGFVGAIAACHHRTIPESAAVITLENSRTFAESPIGGGPIVRVGDRRTTFSPSLTGAVASVAGELARNDDRFVWQRKLMAGGTCEATVFCAFGYEATCVCLPLGNYHNQADLVEVEADAERTTAPVGLEHISIDDFHGLVELLVACGHRLDDAEPAIAAIDRLYESVRHVLET